MPMAVSLASPADAGRIAEIHMAAFGSNAMLLAQFPTLAVRNALQNSIKWKTLADIKDPKMTVLIVRDLDQTHQDQNGDCGRLAEEKLGRNKSDANEQRHSKVIGFAKWAHPIADDEEYVESPWTWPEGTDLAVLEKWTKKVEEAHESVLGQAPCYYLQFIGTDPLYEKRGVASSMLRWGMEQCKKDKVPAYLESTIEAAPFYEKNGFTAVKTFSIKLEASSENNELEAYEEICFLFKPWNI